MNLNGLFSDLNIKRKDLIYLTAIFIISTLICISKINYYSVIGFNSDVPVYLSNAMYFAGVNYNKILPISWLNNGPLVCFLTSILFRLGFVTPKSLYLVTAVFEVFGVVGCYIFLRNRFDSVLSFLGCVFFMSTYLFLQCSASGLTDIPALSVSVWILIFAILAFNRNPRYFIATSLLFMAGMLIRPTVGFVLVPIFLYFVYKHDIVRLIDELLTDRKEFKSSVMTYLKGEEFRYILLSCLIFIALYCVAMFVYHYVFDLNFNLLERIGDSAGGFKSHKNTDLGYHEDVDYYSRSLLYYMSFFKIKFLGVALSDILAGITVVGLILKAYNVATDLKGGNDGYYNSSKFDVILIALMVILMPIAFIGFGSSHFLSNTAIVLMFAIAVSLMKQAGRDSDNNMFFILNVSLMITYFVFISSINIKVSRYALPLFIPIAYLFVLAIETILNSICTKFKSDNRNLKAIFFKVVPLLFVVLLLGSIFITLEANDGNGGLFNYSKIYNDTQHTSEYLMDFDEDYMDKNITTDHRERFYNWFLQRSTNQIDNLYQPLSMFDECGSDYILLNESVEFENYTELYHHRNSHLYINNNLYDV